MESDKGCGGAFSQPLPRDLAHLSLHIFYSKYAQTHFALGAYSIAR